MNLKYIFCLFIIYVIGDSCFAQSKKTVLKNKIKSVIENVTLYENGKEVTYKESYILYNKEGQVLTETKYNKDGSIKKQETFQYATGRNMTEKIIYHQADEDQKKGIENKRTTFKYNLDNDKTEEVEYDSNSKVIQKVIYAYNNKGEKNSETSYDGEGKMKKKVNYTYNRKSLKTKRESYLVDNTLESIKTYTYEFY